MAIFCQIFGPKSGPDGSGRPSGFIWTKFQAKPSILDPFRTKFDVFGPDRNFGQPGFGLGLALDKPHCCWKAQPLSETSTLCAETGQMSALATEDMSAVETGPMSAAETGQMSAVETRQMSAAETGQMSAVPESSGFAWACGVYEVAPAGV